MAVWLFTQAILEDRPVRLFNHGHMRRDFTYVDDVIEAVVRLIEAPPAATAADATAQASPQPPHRIYNVGNQKPVEVVALLDVLEKVIGKSARRELLPMRPIDVLETFADSSELQRATGFAPRTPIEDGLRSFVTWYRGYRGNT
jgi:UDP-glucuronate 4-epimerase